MVSKWLNKFTQPTEAVNSYIEPKRLRVAKTIYPNGVKQMSLNGKDEWYGLQEK
jgi:hypothetical protein